MNITIISASQAPNLGDHNPNDPEATMPSFDLTGTVDGRFFKGWVRLELGGEQELDCDFSSTPGNDPNDPDSFPSLDTQLDIIHNLTMQPAYALAVERTGQRWQCVCPVCS